MADETKSASELKKEDWMNSKWRPAMGWMYMLTCITDFVLFPILWSLLQTVMKQPITQWQPLTLQGAGLFHIAMGAVLGLAAWGRTQEKLGGANNGGAQTPATGFQGGPSTFGQSQSGGFGNSGGFGSPAPAGFNSNPGFGAPASGPYNPAPSWGTTPVAPAVVAGFGGKPAPMQPEQPQI
jgi:Holin of 3TMs, for gene-transfer release